MTTVSRSLPERPHLDIPKREARELLDQCKKRDKDALERIKASSSEIQGRHR